MLTRIDSSQISLLKQEHTLKEQTRVIIFGIDVFFHFILVLWVRMKLKSRILSSDFGILVYRIKYSCDILHTIVTAFYHLLMRT